MTSITALVSPWRVRMLALIYRTAAVALPLLVPACTVIGSGAA